VPVTAPAIISLPAPSVVAPSVAAPTPPPAAIVAAVPAAAPAAPRAQPGAGGRLAEVEAVVRSVVSEKTGYPPEMLEPQMGLDADLGIDSIKRVEILSALQEKLPGAPTVKPEHLGTLHTLRDIAAFLAGGAAPTVESPKPEPVVARPL